MSVAHAPGSRGQEPVAPAARGPRRDRRRSHRAGAGVRRRRVTVYVTSEELALLRARADAFGVSMARVLVDGALHSASSQRIDGAMLDAYLGALVDMQANLQRIGGNLNQLAHHANATADFPTDASAVSRRVRSMLVRLEEILESVSR